MKLAVVLFGQPRFWDLSYKSIIQETTFENSTTDYYFHFWDKIAYNTDDPEYKLTDTDKANIVDAYKPKKYSLWRIDTWFSKTKYNSIKFIKNGGWHFSNIKSPKEIEHKLKSYLHHREFDEEPLTLDQIDNIIKSKQAIYDLKVDKTVNKVGSGSNLINYSFDKLPVYLRENKENYKEWLD